MPLTDPQMIDYISTRMIKPSPANISHNVINLTPWELEGLSFQYVQVGILFTNLMMDHVDQYIYSLRSSLSATLHHFYPLCGRLRMEWMKNDKGLIVSVDVNAGDGIPFTHAIAKDVSSGDVAEDEIDRALIRSLFPLNDAINYDGHILPLLAVQVTELTDGFFVGLSFNHAVGDGNSFLGFYKAWAKMCRHRIFDRNASLVSLPLVHERWFPEGVNLPIKLPFKNADEFVERYYPSLLRLQEKIFHFSSQSISLLKSKVSKEMGAPITSFQALCSFLWRTVTRARHLPPQQEITCIFAIDNRYKINPRLPHEYSGCAAAYVTATTTVEDLIRGGNGFGAMLVLQRIEAHTDSVIRKEFREWVEKPQLFSPSEINPCGITIDSSPKFDLYGVDFGWGAPVAARSGPGSKFDGKVFMYKGREGGASIDVEIDLASKTMAALELDEEFTNMVSPKDAIELGVVVIIGCVIVVIIGCVIFFGVK